MAIKRAKRSFSYWVKGNPRTVTAGTLVDWLKAPAELKKRADLFEDVSDVVAVETATAEPGEKRSITPPKEPAKPTTTPPKPATKKEGEK